MDNYGAALAAELHIGDSIIGADDGEYLIEDIRIEDNHTYTLHCLDEAGRAVKTTISNNVLVNRINSKPELSTGRFGMRQCDLCGKMRSNARGWTDDDYMCKMCRKEHDGRL